VGRSTGDKQTGSLCKKHRRVKVEGIVPSRGRKKLLEFENRRAKVIRSEMRFSSGDVVGGFENTIVRHNQKATLVILRLS